MTRVISSPSISTIGFLTLILSRPEGVLLDDAMVIFLVEKPLKLADADDDSRRLLYLSWIKVDRSTVKVRVETVALEKQRLTRYGRLCRLEEVVLINIYCQSQQKILPAL